jgi:hypothetical protein
MRKARKEAFQQARRPTKALVSGPSLERPGMRKL